MKRALLLLVPGALLASNAAQAYEYSGAKWARDQMPIPYVVHNSLSTDVPDRDGLAAIQMGYDAWNALPCSYMRWEYQGRTNDDTWGATDGQNIASWREEDWDQPSVVLGICSTVWDFQGNLNDTDIKFNGRDHAWAKFGDAPGGFDGRTDIASVSTHEVGHALGLGHSDVPGSTMWPSTGPGDISGRSPGADDIAGVCEIYPSGGEVPDPDTDPPPPRGDIPFGEDCSEGNCDDELVCISDGRDRYCSKLCEPSAGGDCPQGYYCAPLSGGGGTCARGEDPGSNLAGFGETCGQDVGCSQGLVCVNDESTFYCTSPCLNGACPGGYFCTGLQGGGDICARGEDPGGDGGGGPGQPCDERGLCERGLFCLNDGVNIDEETGENVPYCTSDCPDETCEAGFRCVEVPPQGTACQLIPSAGDRSLGDPCWVNPEQPFNPPSCGGTLICVDYRFQGQEVVEKGTCTKNCSADDCCPDGWGCIGVTPVFAQCREGSADEAAFACTGTRPGVDGEPGGNDNLDAGLGDGTDGGTSSGGDGGGGGCDVGRGGGGGALALMAFGVGLVTIRRRRSRRG